MLVMSRYSFFQTDPVPIHPFASRFMDFVGWVIVDRARALRYCLSTASTGKEDLCLYGTGICSQQYRSFLWQRITIYDP